MVALALSVSAMKSKKGSADKEMRGGKGEERYESSKIAGKNSIMMMRKCVLRWTYIIQSFFTYLSVAVSNE